MKARLCAFVLLGSAALASPSAADTAPQPHVGDPSSLAISECVEDHETARVLRLEKRLFEAREVMNRCATEVCPLAIRSDCRQWSEDVTRALPTLVLLVERDDEAEGPVQVYLDDRALELDDRARSVEVLPGRHTLRFLLGSRPPLEREVTLAEGEKNHVVRVRFPSLSRAQGSRHTSVQLLPPPEEPSRPVPSSTYVLGGAALVSLAVSTVLLITALNDLEDARDTCRPGCSEDTRQSIETRLLLADVGIGAGLVLGGLSAYSYLDRPIVTRTGAARSRPGPIGLTWSQQF